MTTDSFIGIRRVGGMLARVDKREGGAFLEVMAPGGTWVPNSGETNWGDILLAPPASAETLAKFGVDKNGEPV